VTLIQAGTPPLETLRYHLTKGGTTASELMYDVDVKNDGQGGAVPTLVVDFETTVQDVLADGSAQLRIAVLGARVRERPGSQLSDELVRGQAAALRGVVITETLASDGNVTGSRVEAAGASDKASDKLSNMTSDKVAGQIDELLHALERVAMRFPAEPVGVGAVWRERRTLPEGGIRAVSEITTTLASRSGSAFSYTSMGQAAGGPQTIEQDGAKVEVTDTHGRSSAQGSVDLSRYAVEATASSTFATTMTVIAPDAGPGAERSTVEIATTIRMTPSAAAASGSDSGTSGGSATSAGSGNAGSDNAGSGNAASSGAASGSARSGGGASGAAGSAQGAHSAP
jgi:hypothetical protein